MATTLGGRCLTADSLRKRVHGPGFLQRRKRSTKRPPMPCSSRPKRRARWAIAVNVKSISAISTSRSKRSWGRKKNFHIYFSYARKNEAQRTGLSILWDGQPLASDCRSIMLRSLLFEHNAVRVAQVRETRTFLSGFVMTQAEAWIHKRAPNANVRFAPGSGHKWLWRGTSAFDPSQTFHHDGPPLSPHIEFRS